MVVVAAEEVWSSSSLSAGRELGDSRIVIRELTLFTTKRQKNGGDRCAQINHRYAKKLERCAQRDRVTGVPAVGKVSVTAVTVTL